MSLFGSVTKQFIDVIEWNETKDGVLAYRYPVEDQEIQSGARLTVRESQLALFVNEGQLADVFAPGLHTLTTRTLPVLTNLRNWDKAFASPFKSDVYFFSTRDQLDQRWGTATPIAVRDKDFGSINVRAHGTFSYRINSAPDFFRRISGTRDVYTAEDLSAQLRSNVLTALSTLLGTAEIPFVDMAASQQNFSDQLKSVLAPAFEAYGLTLVNFNVQSVSLPEEVQTHFNRATSMRMVGDLRAYAQFQAAESFTQPSTGGGAADVAKTVIGLGAGVALGQTLTPSLNPASAKDALATVAHLHELFVKGALTEQEYNEKKAAILKTLA